MTAITGSMDRRDAVDTFAVLMMLGLTFTWGLNGVAAKLAYQGYSPIFLAVARSAIGAVLVFLWCRHRSIRLFDADGTLWPGVAAGLLFGAEFILIFISLEYTTVARSALMVNTMPFWVLLGAHFMLGERMSLAKLGGVALAFVGVVLVFSDELSLPGPEAITGDLLSLLAGALWAATTIVIKSTRLADTSAEKLLLYQLVAAAALAVPLLPFFGPMLRDVTALATGALLFQSIVVVAISYLLWFWLMRRYPAAGLASFAFLTPVFGVLCGSVILGEPWSWKIVLALALIAAGLIIVNKPSRRLPPA